MLTVDFNRFTLGPGMTVLDVGCGQGRHSFEALRRGADVTAFDFSQSDLDEVETYRGRSVHLEAPGVTAYADGDPIAALPITIDAEPGALTVFAPAEPDPV